MAKLRARGRTEIFKVERAYDTKPGDLAASAGIFWKKHSITLASDGNILERSSFKVHDKYAPSGVRSEPGTWKIRSKIKAGATAESLLEQYARKGYTVIEAHGISSFDRAYYDALTASAKGGASPPARSPATAAQPGRVIVSEKKAATRERAKVKGAARRAHEQATRHGHGFYVRNRTTGPMRQWTTDEKGPWKTLDDALPHAWERHQEFFLGKLNYLMPVQIVEAKSRQAAEWGEEGHIFWTGGKHRGPPVHPRQMALFS